MTSTTDTSGAVAPGPPNHPALSTVLRSDAGHGVGPADLAARLDGDAGEHVVGVIVAAGVTA